MFFHDDNMPISYSIEELQTNNITDTDIHSIEPFIYNEHHYNIDNTINEQMIRPTDCGYAQLGIMEYDNDFLLYDYSKYTLKELFNICSYYGFAKELKTNKYNKRQIIQYLIEYENDYNNIEIVYTRNNLWFYMNELKKDKFMKNFIIW